MGLNEYNLIRWSNGVMEQMGSGFELALYSEPLIEHSSWQAFRRDSRPARNFYVGA